MAGIIQDKDYFDKEVSPYLGKEITYIGSVGYKRQRHTAWRGVCALASD